MKVRVSIAQIEALNLHDNIFKTFICNEVNKKLLNIGLIFALFSDTKKSLLIYSIEF